MTVLVACENSGRSQARQGIGGTTDQGERKGQSLRVAHYRDEAEDRNSHGEAVLSVSGQETAGMGTSWWRRHTGAQQGGPPPRLHGLRATMPGWEGVVAMDHAECRAEAMNQARCSSP